MTRALSHRGPDDEGFFQDAEVALGFRRLAVIDLETGQQPIELENGRYAIVLNGEIYNFRELRTELEEKGHVFYSRGDVEVVLRLFAEQGLACLQRLNGMFALALWDGRNRTLHLARDRFGIKPLYWCREPNGVGFASELRALGAGGFPADRAIDPVELRHYLAFGHTSSGGTLFERVRSVPPATVLSLAADGVERAARYWRPPESEAETTRPADVAARLRAVLADAVERQLVADVPVGVFLSGGVDSSTVAAFARRAVADPLETFSVGFVGPGARSELPAARRVANSLGSRHHELVMEPDVVARDLETIVGGLDSPLADPTAIPTWYMSRLARQTVTVALSGEGADEVFGGYERQRYDVAMDRLGAVGRRVIPWAMRLAGRTPSKRLLERVAMAPGLARQLHWGRIFTAGEIDELTGGRSATEHEVLARYDELAAEWRRLDRHDPVNGRLATDREVFLPGDLLPKVDRMSMAHSLEVRVPFLDNEVVDFVLPLPGSLKVSARRDKILLRSAVEGVIPRTAATRRKQPFEVPIGGWIRGPLREFVGDLLALDSTRSTRLFDADTVRRRLDDHLQARTNHGMALWTLAVLEHWLRDVDVPRPGGGA